MEFSETHSPRSKRAKLIQRPHGAAPRKYFLAEDEPLVIKLASQRDPDRQAEGVKCEQIERQNLIDDLFEAEGGPRELATNWLTNHDHSKFPDYVLGIAQLLLIFDSNRDRLKPIRDMQRIRELQCQRYDLEWKFGRLELILTVYVGDDALTWNGAQLPMRIWVITREWWKYLHLGWHFSKAIEPPWSTIIHGGLVVIGILVLYLLCPISLVHGR